MICVPEYNVLIVIADSMRPDYLGTYGNEWVRTPNIDRFARDSVVFLNAYPEGLPTIPVRTAVLTGQRTLPFRPWRPLEDEDITAPEIFGQYGYVCALITDTYHLFKPGMNLHKGFHVFRWIRGQEADAYASGPIEYDLDEFLKPEMRGTDAERILTQYLRNISYIGRRSEEDYFAAMVVREALRWLDRNSGSKFFLVVDMFDPHEPWDPPPNYRIYVDPSYSGRNLIQPKYGRTDIYTEDELKYMRSLYAGEVTFVDRWFGMLIDKLKEKDLYDRTLIVLMSDHGVPIGEHGWILKHPHTLWYELVRMTLMIKFPEGRYAGRKVEALVQGHDILPTILSYLGLEKECIDMHGKSILPVLEGEKDRVRSYIVTGYHASLYRNIRTEEWSLIFSPKGDHKLYNLKRDPLEKNNLIEEERDVARGLASMLSKYCILRALRREVERKRILQLLYELSGIP